MFHDRFLNHEQRVLVYQLYKSRKLRVCDIASKFKITEYSVYRIVKKLAHEEKFLLRKETL